jgi:hypothetical protein
MCKNLKKQHFLTKKHTIGFQEYRQLVIILSKSGQTCKNIDGKLNENQEIPDQLLSKKCFD